MNFKSQTAVAVLGLIASATAFSQTAAPAPSSTLTYNIGAVSDYRFRGIEQSAGQPSLQGGADFAHASGLYVGVWGANNIRWIKDFNQATQGVWEVDLYGGLKGEIKPGLSYDVGVITYQYPDNNSGAVGTPGAGSYSKADTNEFYGALTYGIFTVKYNQSVGDFLGNLNSNGSRYWDLSANFDLGNGLTLTPHIGYQTIPNQTAGSKVGNAADYSDYALTLAKDFGNGWAASIAAIGTDAKPSGTMAFYRTGTNFGNRFLASGTVVLGVKYSF